MKPQELSNQNQLRLNNQVKSMQKQVLRPNNLILSRFRSLRTQINKNNSIIHRIDMFEDRNFVPKLKSKQLTGEPKFFFSLQRRKIKLQNSSPSFSQVRTQNPQMKGCKVKRKSTLKSENQVRSKQLTERNQSGRRMPRFSQNYTSHSNGSLEGNDTQFKQKICSNLSFIDSISNTTQLKKNKRPNIYENISFLIRRRKQIKNIVSLNRIDNSRHYMTEATEKRQ